MYCNSYERESNGSCVSCAPNFTGPDCIDIECEHGEPDKYEQKCVCIPPYKGDFCNKLETEDVYLLYNTRVAVLGPLGALSIIPMILLYYCCEHFAKAKILFLPKPTFCRKFIAEVYWGLSVNNKFRGLYINVST
jgi:hypothetical protein